MSARMALIVLLGLACGHSAPAQAFAIFRGFGATPAETLQMAARWSSTTGLADGIQVAVQPGLAAALAAPGEDPALVERAVLTGLNAWEQGSPVLDIDVLLETRGYFEVNLYARPNSDPVFANNSFFGFADPRSRLDTSRPLTNGQSFRGFVIYHADVYLNIDNLMSLVPLGPELRRDVITRVTMHEFGHALGLGHPNANNPFGAQTNYDTDRKPRNVMVIDPQDPFADIQASPRTNDQAIMSNGPCGIPPTLCDAASYTALRRDDRGGRDVLYPAPEPSTALLVGLGCLALAAAGSRPGRPARHSSGSRRHQGVVRQPGQRTTGRAS